MTRLGEMLVAFGLAASLGGCSRAPMTGPPELRLGREECAECGMLVSDERAGSAMLVERDGERLYLFYDDIGCMLDHEYDGKNELSVLERYVHDHGSRSWVPAEKAAYLFAPPQTLLTPMGSGIAAFADRAGAEEVRTRVGGEIHDSAGIEKARREWMWARYGRPEGAPPAQAAPGTTESHTPTGE